MAKGGEEKDTKSGKKKSDSGERSSCQKALLYGKIFLCLVLLGGLGYGGLYVYNNFFKDDDVVADCSEYHLLWDSGSCTPEKWGAIIIVNESRPHTVKSCGDKCTSNSECENFILDEETDCILLKGNCTRSPIDKGVALYQRKRSACVDTTQPGVTPSPPPPCKDESSWIDKYPAALGSSCLEYVTNKTFKSEVIPNTTKDSCGCSCLSSSWCESFLIWEDDCILLQEGCTLADTAGFDYFGPVPKVCEQESSLDVTFPQNSGYGCREYFEFTQNPQITTRKLDSTSRIECGCECLKETWCDAFVIQNSDCYLLPSGCTLVPASNSNYFGRIKGDTRVPMTSTPRTSLPDNIQCTRIIWDAFFTVTPKHGCLEYNSYASDPAVTVEVVEANVEQCGCKCYESLKCKAFVIWGGDCHMFSEPCTPSAISLMDLYGMIQNTYVPVNTLVPVLPPPTLVPPVTSSVPATAEPVMECSEDSSWDIRFPSHLGNGCAELSSYESSPQVVILTVENKTRIECGCECIDTSWCVVFIMNKANCILVSSRCTVDGDQEYDYFGHVIGDTDIPETASPPTTPVPTTQAPPSTESPPGVTLSPPTNVPDTLQPSPANRTCVQDSSWDTLFKEHVGNSCVELSEILNSTILKSKVINNIGTRFECGCRCLNQSWCSSFVITNDDCYLLSVTCSIEVNASVSYYGPLKDSTSIPETVVPVPNQTTAPIALNATCEPEARNMSQFAHIPKGTCSEMSIANFTRRVIRSSSLSPPALSFTKETCSCQCYRHSWCKGFQLSGDFTTCTLFQEGCTVSQSFAVDIPGNLFIVEPALALACKTATELLTTSFKQHNESICVTKSAAESRQGDSSIVTPEQCGCECDKLKWCQAFTFDWEKRNCTFYAAGGCDDKKTGQVLTTAFVRSIPPAPKSSSSSPVGVIVGIAAAVLVCGCVGGLFYVKKKKSSKKSENSTKFNFELGYENYGDEALTDYADLTTDSLEEAMAQDYLITCINCYEPAPTEDGSCSRCGHSLSPERERFTFSDRASTVLRNIKAVYL